MIERKKAGLFCLSHGHIAPLLPSRVRTIVTVAKLLIMIGLIMNILDVGRLTRDLILTKSEATELAVFHQPGEDLEVQSVLRQSRNAQIGLALMILGFVEQLVGTLLW
jgi:hypothetical protein